MESQNENETAENKAEPKNMEVVAEVHEQLVPQVEHVDEVLPASQPEDAEISGIAEDIQKKLEDTKHKTDLMDVAIERAPNNGDCFSVNEIMEYGDDTQSHSKSDMVMKKRRSKVHIIERPFLPRKSKTKAFEKLKNIARGIAFISIAVGKRVSNPKRLKRKSVRGNYNQRQVALRAIKRKPHKTTRPRLVRSRMVLNQDSGTSISTMSSGSCSTCKDSRGSSQRGSGQNGPIY